ncbi:MAG: oligopeptide transporter, OPT family [candidate division Zixibacteria bacterium RBG_16_50_21]|nr:MAG: oligopeptide transporter, OPT family [candidate division Zixibacteria bacterium RBG_16_50_21]
MSESEFKPFVSPFQSPREFTFRAVFLGAILGIVFAASSVYLALKVGMTVSASIPIAVLSITLFRFLGRASILENNIVQTTGSAGESIAFGVATTMPVFLLLGQDMEILSILWMALLGGILGVLMMIPLRKGLIVKEHGKLTYPEGTACADVLIVGEQGGTNAKTVFLGFGIGALYKLLNVGFKLWAEIPTRLLTFFKGASISAEVTPELVGVGYIIGPKVAANMMAGGMVSYLILIPAITIFGEHLTSPMFPASTLIRDMTPNLIRNAYVLYIGAGAVATGGIISLIKSFPTIVSAFRRGLGTFLDSRAGKIDQSTILRTDRDLPLSVVVLGSIGIILAIWLSPVLHINAVSAVLIVLFGFFFVTVSSRITGEIGSSSNPISGMTVATLLFTCLLFVAAGWTGVSFRAMALCTAAIVCIAASNGGTISQDLKTGFLVGATPRLQQIGIMIGVISSALIIGLIVIALNDAYTTVVPAQFPEYVAAAQGPTQSRTGPDGKTYRVHYVTEQTGTVLVGKYLVDQNNRIKYLIDPGIAGVVSEVDGKPVTKLDSPKARLFSLIIDGILTQKLPWGLVLIGVFLALVMELVGVSSLPFAVGLYLPLSSSAPIMAGGAIRALVNRKNRSSATEAEFSPGVLMSSGFIAGAAIMGVLLAALTGLGFDRTINFSNYLGHLAEADWFAMIPFLVLVYILYKVATTKSNNNKMA